MKWKNSHESYPAQDGQYFVIDHCGQKCVFSYRILDAKWTLMHPHGKYEDICPTCYRFQWLEEMVDNI